MSKQMKKHRHDSVFILLVISDVKKSAQQSDQETAQIPNYVTTLHILSNLFPLDWPL